MERKALVKTLELAARALADGSLVPIYKCFAFDEANQTVTAYNDLIGVVAPCEGLENDFCVDGTTLLGLLTNSRGEDLAVSIEEQDVIIKAGRSTFKLPFFPLADFLFEEPLDDKWDTTIPITPDLLAGISACLITSSKDNAQPALMGVCLSKNDKNAVLYSCDGDAISEYTLSTKAGSVDEPAMMPNAFCETLLALTTELNVTKGHLAVNKEWVRANLANDYLIYGRIIENNNPLDFAAQMDKTMPETPEFIDAPKGLDNALSRARVVADPESAKSVVTVEKGRLRLVTTAAMGVVRDTLAIAEHADVEANVSAALMQRSLSLCNEMVIFEGCCAFRSKKLFVLVSNMG